jgi:hypothetical protein
MKTVHLFNVLDGFDFNLVDNPEFKEDSVREELIVPILKGLGYSAHKPNQIIRSKKLLHPFVSIGSMRKEIYLIPDYLFIVNGKPAWILDAKAPKESITKSQHVEQAYSYAIHSEVRVNYFALCNGKEFVLYNTQKTQPLLYFPIMNISLYWEELIKFLAPDNVLADNQFKLAKDLGLHLKRLGFESFESLVFPNVPVTEISQLEPNMFCLSGGFREDESNYVVTFDFDIDAFQQLKGLIPDIALEKLKIRNKEFRQVVRFPDRAYLISIDCKIGESLQENEDEIFLPLVVNRFLG